MAQERILIVDDDPAVVRALQLFFRHEGLTAEGRPCGFEGLAATRETPTTSSCSTLTCPTSTALRYSSACGPPATPRPSSS